ncbi:uncharacterized protein T551_02580 [Pneumocystis jirovecii RU7]|uniref:FAD-binding FR-type domain-containing protein n=1 Tax=Pneumocystis jirovecii (strain RU7) TaxID=1408657 RepID=A0A0W4ZK36_PNEJ7|nr:uncharacterized protein T551_02580 [Pneumocystis jirovecii RU7]KTW28730.1 hypothetical protein T551_02580 [Pneumocystis jirovecii RU7]
MRFGVFGIGSTQYPRCGWACMRAGSRAQVQLVGEEAGAAAGATRCTCTLCPRRGGRAERRGVGVWAALERWSEGLWAALEAAHPLPPGLERLSEDELLPASFSVAVSVAAGGPGVEVPIRVRGRVRARVLRNARITAEEHWQEVRHVVLGVDGAVEYRPGDRVVLYPKNPEREVSVLLECMGWAGIADAPLSIISRERQGEWGVWGEGGEGRTTLRHLFTEVLDFMSVPRRTFFEFLAHFTENRAFAEKMRHFCTQEGQEDMYSYAGWPRRTILEVIQDFWPVNVPLDYIFDVFPVMRGRKFSIASSWRVNPGRIDLCVAIVKYKTVLRGFRYGVCTRWVSVLSEGMEIGIDVLPGVLRKTGSPMVPIVLVGPGTGVSPLRSLIQERIFEGSKDNVLFFGCRSKDKDFLFRDEWMGYCSSGNLILLTAFSRDQDEKKYVQHIMEEHSKIVYDYLYNKQGILYLSGNSRFMPEVVKQAFLNILMKEGNFTFEQSKACLLAMEKGGRYMQETWS